MSRCRTNWLQNYFNPSAIAFQNDTSAAIHLTLICFLIHILVIYSWIYSVFYCVLLWLCFYADCTWMTPRGRDKRSNQIHSNIIAIARRARIFGWDVAKQTKFGPHTNNIWSAGFFKMGGGIVFGSFMKTHSLGQVTENNIWAKGGTDMRPNVVSHKTWLSPGWVLVLMLLRITDKDSLFMPEDMNIWARYYQPKTLCYEGDAFFVILLFLSLM